MPIAACPRASARVAPVGLAARNPTRRLVAVRASLEPQQEQEKQHLPGRRQALVAGGVALAGLVLPGGNWSSAVAAKEPTSIYGLSALMYDEDLSFERYKNQNVNYPGARALYDKYKADGFNIVAFPCNQFGGQAPGTSQEEREWAWRKFGFEFDVFDKIEVNGPGTHPIYRVLKAQQPVSLPSSERTRPPPGELGRIEWNYTKFLVDRNGVPVKRFKSAFNPADFEDDVRLLLAGKPPLPGECIMHPGRKVCKVDL